MGRGIAYCYEFFMLVDDSADGVDESGNWDDDLARIRADDFVQDALLCFGADKLDRVRPHQYYRDAYFIGETDKLRIGIDTGGGLPCIFVEPLYDEDNPKIDDLVREGFNKLIQLYEPGKFRRPTSAWTSAPLETY